VTIARHGIVFARAIGKISPESPLVIRLPTGMAQGKYTLTISYRRSGRVRTTRRTLRIG
jgi:hypothetical protein